MLACVRIAVFFPCVLLAASVCRGESAARPPLVLSFRAHGLFQEIEVTENKEFYMASEIHASKWVVLGTIGEIVQGKVTVDIGIEFGSGQSREKTSRQFDLTIDAAEARSYSGGGSVVGSVPISAVWIRRGVDPWPALLNGLAKRDACFLGSAQYAGRLGRAGAPATPLLIEALSSEDEAVRIVAANTLGQIGSAAKEALSKLQKLAARADDADASDAAADAIAKIEADVSKLRPQQ